MADAGAAQTGSPDARIANMQQNYPSRAAVVSWIFIRLGDAAFFHADHNLRVLAYFATHVASDPASGQALWGFPTAAAGLIIALMSPVLGAIADRSGRRKPWIAVFGALLVIGSGLMWFPEARRHQPHSALLAYRTRPSASN